MSDVEEPMVISLRLNLLILSHSMNNEFSVKMDFFCDKRGRNMTHYYYRNLLSKELPSMEIIKIRNQMWKDIYTMLMMPWIHCLIRVDSWEDVKTVEIL